MVFDMILIGLCCFFFLLATVLGYKLYQFAMIIINIEDSIEESLDIIDERYKKINEIAQRPVFFDSVEIRQVISEIKETHRAILLIANKLSKNVKGVIEDGEEKDQLSKQES